MVEGLSYVGFDVLSIANNHIWDWGSVALVQTADLLHSENIETVGAGKDFNFANAPAIFTAHDLKIGYLGYTNLYAESFSAHGGNPGVSDFNPEKIRDRIRDLKSQSDIVVVSLHWGEEYTPGPSEWQREFAHSLVDVGADFVIGHHPHVIQEIEHYKDGWIAYSLGNFVFDQNFSEETTEGLLLKAVLNRREIKEVQTVKIKISESFQPYRIHDWRGIIRER